MTRLSLKWLLACMLISGSAMAAENTPDQLTDARIAATPPTIGANSFYISNGPALAASPLVKLPIGSIVPKGWLRHQLELEAQGTIGHLEELSHWCKFEGGPERPGRKWLGGAALLAQGLRGSRLRPAGSGDHPECAAMDKRRSREPGSRWVLRATHAGSSHMA